MKTSQKRVLVREGSRGRALRIDGTFASWYSPGSPTTGSVWDAIAAPVLLLPPARRRRILVLGLGGGSVARVLRALAPRAHIVGIEYDPHVIRAARRWFDLEDLGVEVIEGDARRFLERSRRSFDAVIEDVFIGSRRTLRKPEGLVRPGLARAARRLSRGGILACNAIDEAPEVALAVSELFPASLRIHVEGYDNTVVVGGPRAISARLLRSAVGANPVLRETLPLLRFRRLLR